MTERYTHKNPDGHTFRAPVERLGEFRVLQSGLSIAIFGDLVDRLGEYEELLTLDEAKDYAKRKTDRRKPFPH